MATVSQPASASASMTCTACHFQITSVSARVEHYKTDWHRYNIKRSVANLEPLSQELFRRKVVEHRRAQAAEAETFSCEPCHKLFRSEGAFKQHQRSKKHKKQVAKKQAQAQQASQRAQQQRLQRGDGGADEEVEEAVEALQRLDVRGKDPKAPPGGASESGIIPVGHCLFCDVECGEPQDVLRHMLAKHGFFVPYRNQLVDVEGFLEYLGAKLGLGHVCLFCNTRFPSQQAVRQHMFDKGHCKLAFDTVEDEDEMEPFYDFTRDDKKAPVVADVNSAGELILVDGSIIGHRSLNKYYRQTLLTTPQAPSKAQRALNEQRAITLPGYQKRADHAQQPRRRDVQRKRREYVRRGVKNNNQKHFRDAVVF